MPWIRLDDQFYDGPKHAPLSAGAGWLWVLTLAWCNRHLTDGRFPKAIARQLGTIPNRAGAIKELVAGGLWLDDDSHYVVANYLDYQDSRAQVEQRRAEVSESRSAAGRAGAAKRWQTDGKADGKAIANGMANGWQSDSPKPLPKPLRDTSPDNCKSVAPDGGGEDVSTKVLVRMAKAELRLEQDRGTVRSEDRWMAAKVESLRQSYGDRMASLLSRDPGLDEHTLHGILTSPQKRMEWERERRAGCSTCSGTGHLIDDSMTARPCPTCSPSERVSA